jgi:general secretion pathway protein M
MNRSQDVLAERKRIRDQQLMRYARPAPQLASFIEKAAQENGIDVPESKDRPDAPKGKRYTERVTTVTLRKIGMAALVKTLEKIEQSGYPVAITRLVIKKRAGGPDMWDVELGVSAFDRKEEKKEGGAAGTSSARSAPSPSTVLPSKGEQL